MVLSALLAVASCKPTAVLPAATLPLAPGAWAAPYAHGVAPLAYAAPYAHGVAPLAYAAPAVVPVPAVAPVQAHAITKTVHYAQTPVVTGYHSTVVKPDLGRLATPLHTVSQTPVVAPAR